MKKLTYITLLSLTGILSANAQNLVLNPSFEEYVPDSINGSNGNGDIAKSTHWINVGPASSDYFHSDYNQPNYSRVPENETGMQAPHTGNAYAGIYTFEVVNGLPDMRDYIRTQLSSPLQANKNYRISLYASLADHSNYAMIFGINLSPTPINTFNGWLMEVPSAMQLQNPITDKQNWTYLSWNYLAQGGEEYLTIGGFTPDSDLDTTIVGGIYSMAYYYIDDVSVTLNSVLSTDEAESTPGFTIYPNPVSDVLILESTATIYTDKLTVTDASGRKINAEWHMIGNNSCQLSTADWASGIYFIGKGNGAAVRFMKN